MMAYLKDGLAEIIRGAATPRETSQIELAIPPSHSILTPGQQVLVMIVYRQVPITGASTVPISKSLVWLSLEKSPTGKAGFDPGSVALEVDALPLGHRGGADGA